MFLCFDLWFQLRFSPGYLRVVAIEQSKHLFRKADVCIRELLEEESLEVDNPSSFKVRGMLFV
jgi:hypothetical protein